MGFLSKAIDTRVEQILLNHFGRPIKSDFVVSGYLNIMHLQVSRLAFSAGVNSDGVFIIHEGRVLIALAWDDILNCEPNLMTSGVELVIRLSADSQTAPKENILLTNGSMQPLISRKLKTNRDFCSSSMLKNRRSVSP